MLKKDVRLGSVYNAKISGNVVAVSLDSVSPHGGWNATNLSTGRSIRIKSAAKLHMLVWSDLPKNREPANPQAIVTYEGSRFKMDENDAYSVFTSFERDGTRADPERRLSTYCILDEEDGGYIAFTTDAKLAERIVDTFNRDGAMRAMSGFNCYTQEDAENAAKSMVALSIPFTVTPMPCDEWEVSYPTEHEQLVRERVAEAV